jgi:hypothetical protein
LGLGRRALRAFSAALRWRRVRFGSEATGEMDADFAATAKGLGGADFERFDPVVVRSLRFGLDGVLVVAFGASPNGSLGAPTAETEVNCSTSTDVVGIFG